MDLKEKIALAFSLGRAFKLGKIKPTASDSVAWVTVKPNGEEGKGRHVLLDKETGRIIKGMGPHNGKTLKELGNTPKTPANSKNFKAQQQSSLSPEGLKRREARLARNAQRPKVESLDLTLPPKVDKSLILQNRDRSNAGSRMQMRNIAESPDYERLSTGKKFGDGAPVVAYGTIPKENLGKVVTVVNGDGQKYAVQYAVVEAKDLLSSHDINGDKNDQYYSDDPNLTRAIAGNGRITGLKEAYKNGKAEAYRDALADDSDHGVNADVIDNMTAPVLVRIMQPKDITADIGDKSNIGSNLEMTESEKAHNDMSRLAESLSVGKFAPKFDSDGDPSFETIRDFIDLMPANERGGMIDKNLKPTRQAQNRAANALFAVAYNDPELTRLQSQAIESENKNIMRALEMSVPAMLKLSGLGDGYDIREMVSRAATRVMTARAQGQNVETLSMNNQLFQGDGDSAAEGVIMQLFQKNARSPSRIAEKLNHLADVMSHEWNNHADPSANLFGDDVLVDRNELVNRYLANDSKQGRGMSKRARNAWKQYGGNFVKAVFDSALKAKKSKLLLALKKL